MVKKKRITGGKSSVVILSTPRRGNLDIEAYSRNMRAAMNVERPYHAPLFDMYDECVGTDAHLMSLIRKWKSRVLGAPIEFRRNGKVDTQIAEQIKSPWFREFLSDALDETLYGWTPVQFYRDGAWLNYDLIPRKHVDPVRHLIKCRQTDVTGFDWDEFGDFAFIGKPRSLGLLSIACIYSIWKTGNMGDWAQFLELYMQPIREGIYDGADNEARGKLINDLFDMSGNGVLVHSDNTRLQLHTQTSGDGGGYKTFAEYADAQMSKLFLGNTLTSDSGNKGSRSLGEVHLTEESDIIQSDRMHLLDVLNYQVSDIFSALGMNVHGGEFVFNIPKNIDLSKRIEIDCRLRNEMGLPISDDYLYEAYGIEKPANYAALKKSMEQQPVIPVNSKALSNTLNPVFYHAPEIREPGADLEF